MVIRQGDVFWIDFGRARGSEPAKRRPALVVQSDLFNRTAIQTTVVAALTTNLRLGEAPGNVRLAKGEAGLPLASVVNVSQIRTLDKSALVDRLGRLSADRFAQVRLGLDLLLGPVPTPH